MDPTLDDVRKWFEAHKGDAEVVKWLAEIAPKAEVTAEQFAEFLDTPEGQRMIEPIADRRVNDGIKTYRENHFDAEVKKRVADEMIKLNPQETPEQKRIRELEEKDRKRDQEWERDKLHRRYLELASAEGVPSFWIDTSNLGSEQEAKVFIAIIKKSYEQIAREAVNKIMASGAKPGAGSEPPGGNGKVDVKKLTEAEAIALEESGQLDAAILGGAAR